MYDSTVVVAEYPTAAEAEIALARLRHEGIEGAVTGNASNAASYSLFEHVPFAPILLSVTSSESERARAILSQLDQELLEEGWEETAEAAVEGWICASCDTEVPLDQTVCSDCGAPRRDRRSEDEDDGDPS